MNNYLIHIMNTDTLDIYPVYRTAASSKEAVSTVKLEPNEKVDSVYLEVTDYGE